MLASYPKATYARLVFKDKKKAWGPAKAIKTLGGNGEDVAG